MKQISNANDVPTKKMKKDETDHKKLTNSNPKLDEGTSKELMKSIEKTITSNERELKGNSDEKINLGKSSVHEINVSRSSKGRDRYTVSYWKNSEPKEGSVQTLNLNEIRNKIKINQIISGELLVNYHL